MNSGITRRRLLASAGAAASVEWLEWGAAHAGEREGPGSQEHSHVLRRIAFGSCAKQSVDQPIWDAINALEPDLFIFLGDNVYGDTRDPAVLRDAYRQLAAKPGFRRLRDRTPVIAIWDDHDFGENDAGGDYPMKEESRRIFCDFWGEPSNSPRRHRAGVYESYLYGPAGRRVQVVLPDLRFNRTPLWTLDLGGRPYRDWAEALAKSGADVPGPYARNPDPAATMLGEEQWRWLENRLSEPAQIRILGSSLQVVADFPGWEAWINFAQDHQRLLQTIRARRANGLVCISGDTHYGELSRLDVNAPYPLWDLTSSGLTEVWPVQPPNARRVGPILREANFGLIDIDWTHVAPRLSLQVRDVSGRVRIEQAVDTAELVVRG